MSTTLIPFWFVALSPVIGLIVGFLGAWLFSWLWLYLRRGVTNHLNSGTEKSSTRAIAAGSLPRIGSGHE
jgi:hypothetical protein